MTPPTESAHAGSERDAGAAGAATKARLVTSPQPPAWPYRPRVHVRLAEDETSIGSTLTGLALLAHEDHIDLEFEMIEPAAPLASGPWHLRDKAANLVELTIDEHYTALLDTHDSWEIDAPALARHDVYFKRSLLPGAMAFPGMHKLHALGLVCDLRIDGIDRYELGRILASRASRRVRVRRLLSYLARCAAASLDRGGRPSLARQQSPPMHFAEPSVLLMAGLWDPQAVPESEPHKREEFAALNQMRADTVRALRRAFGSRCHAGLRHSPFARRAFPDALLPRAADGTRAHFLRAVREHPICVTSTGLHGSNGWRLAEFTALSRAIVAQPPRYVIPGEHAAGTHFAPYRTVAECVEAVGTLFDSRGSRELIMEHNWSYWRRWMHPRALATRIIAVTRGLPREAAPAA